jgi:hypothetical protein
MKQQAPSPSHQLSEISLARLLLHAEGAAVLSIALFLYWYFNGSWLMFVLLLLAPDLAMLGYLKSVRLGSVTYNLVHTYSGPLLLLAAAFTGGWVTGLHLALIWLAHIGLDRIVGYGLKYPTGFKDTHLNRV